MSIRKLKRLYNELYDVKELFNNYISGSLLMGIISSFADIVFSIFIHIIMFQQNVTNLKNKTVTFLEYELTSLTKITLIIILSHNLSKNIEKTGLILARLISRVTDIKEKCEVS